MGGVDVHAPVDEDEEVQDNDDYETDVSEEVHVLEKDVNEGQGFILDFVALLVVVEKDETGGVFEDGVGFGLDRGEVDLVEVLCL